MHVLCPLLYTLRYLLSHIPLSRNKQMFYTLDPILNPYTDMGSSRLTRAHEISCLVTALVDKERPMVTAEIKVIGDVDL